MPERAEPAWRWGAWLAVALALYWPIFGMQPYFDDFVHVERLAGLLQRGDLPVLMRPLQSALLTLDWRWFGLDFWLSKIVSIALLVARAGLGYALARRLLPGASRIGAAIVSLVMIVHPIVVATVGKIDNNTEALASVLGLAAVLLVLRAPRLSAGPEAVALAAIALTGLLTKETFAGLAIALPAMSALASARPDWRRGAAAAIAITAMFGAYLAYRAATGAPLGSTDPGSRYHLHLGLNAVKNAIAGLGAAGYPGSTLDIFVTRRLWPVAVTAGLALVVVLVWVQQRRRLALSIADAPWRVLALALAASLVPLVLINGWPSEHHLVTTAALLWIMIGVVTFGDAGSARRPTVTHALGAALIVWMAAATLQKVAAERELSARGRAMGEAVVAAYEAKPTPAMVLCVEPPYAPKYGQFSIPDWLLAQSERYRLRLKHPEVPPYFAWDLGRGPSPAPCTVLLRGTVATPQ
jgi:hypothetical protein